MTSTRSASTSLASGPEPSPIVPPDRHTGQVEEHRIGERHVAERTRTYESLILI